MIIETLEIGAIFACCSLLTWTAMKKHHSKIERRLQEIESSTELKVTEKRFRK
ncbi:MAG TPA: hypothetical protein VGR54_00715 [Nitrosopumilaceae archaeon]|nr:hypothetical protein [Nitrosopumilaceae archaeon]